MLFRIRTALLAAFLMAGGLSGAVRGAESDHANVGSDRVGIKGYDPVSYFEGTPQKGEQKFTAEYEGVIYRFASDAHKQRFLEAPATFVPAYGGWCAWAFAKDVGKVDIDPTSYRITDGRLFLFYKGWRGDALKQWLPNEKANIPKADANWQKTVEPK